MLKTNLSGVPLVPFGAETRVHWPMQLDPLAAHGSVPVPVNVALSSMVVATKLWAVVTELFCLLFVPSVPIVSKVPPPPMVKPPSNSALPLTATVATCDSVSPWLVPPSDDVLPLPVARKWNVYVPAVDGTRKMI